VVKHPEIFFFFVQSLVETESFFKSYLITLQGRVSFLRIISSFVAGNNPPPFPGPPTWDEIPPPKRDDSLPPFTFFYALGGFLLFPSLYKKGMWGTRVSLLLGPPLANAKGLSLDRFPPPFFFPATAAGNFFSLSDSAPNVSPFGRIFSKKWSYDQSGFF